MIKQPRSIFNDIIGPVMTGPSSSHTAGPARIGRIARQLLDGKLKKIEIEFETKGSFAATYKTQGTDRGLVGGMIGMAPESPLLPRALEETANLGIDVVFNVKDFDAKHPNTARITLTDQEGRTAHMTGLSVGGGMIEITEVEGFAVSMAGDFYELLIFTELLEEMDTAKIINSLELMGVEIQFIDFSRSADRGLLDIKLVSEVSSEILSDLMDTDGVTSARLLSPVMPVLSRKNCKVPFRTGIEMVELAKEKGMEPWEAAAYYESIRSGWQQEKVFSKMKEIVSVMEKSVQMGLTSDKPGQIIKARAGAFIKAAGEGKLIPTGVINTVIGWSMAMVEVNSNYGVVVAAPTAGACGVLPGAILGTAEAMKLNSDDTTKAMLTAGAVGLLIAEHATFAAELCGCQAECGAASAMAAAGIVQLAGGTIEECANAASMALQNVLGMICDSVAELVEVPCLGRNVMGAVNAIACANMALTGVEAVIPLDEVIQSMYHVGLMMPRELCCTGSGGLAVTKTGLEIRRKLTDNL